MSKILTKQSYTMEEKGFRDQVIEGERFEFGKNWRVYLNGLTDEKIEIAKQSLADMLECNDLEGKKFLDVGCGSGLFSLAATKLGASVHSLDFDPYSVRCTELLRERYPSQNEWVIQEGSILNKDYIASLGIFDIVYSWGVLHHTGNMQRALENVQIPVKEKGKLFIAIYNDQGKASLRWKKIKKIYNSGALGKAFIISVFFSYFFLRGLAADILRFKNPAKRYADYKKRRGMSMVRDWYDWLGGYPFEVASPEAIFEYYKKNNYKLTRLKTTSGWGCNQFVFEKS
jgi:2-polyprenyl-3-methyl-5-hydroxy-6-metoxy-1,4-benzoquinol methylase